jgi:DNA modification methylase
MLIQANALRIPLTAGVVQMIATSPPYWGLRKYEGDQAFEWPAVSYVPMAGLPPVDVPAMQCELGLEPSPLAYIAHLVAVMREVRRVMRDDGTLWLNLGDSYAATSKGSGGTKSKQPTNAGSFYSASFDLIDGLKPKDLCGIPWRAALALQADGWYLRSDVIWAKPNVMPESVKDRPTKAHEYVFLLAKLERYYYDADAIKDPVSAVSLARAQNAWHTSRPSVKSGDGVSFNKMGRRFVDPSGRNKRSVWKCSTAAFSGAHFATWPPDLVEPMIKAGSAPGDLVLDPFNGSGTTGGVALSLGRRYVGLDVGYTYLHDIAAPRLSTEFGAGKMKRAAEDAPLDDLPLFAASA